MPKPGMVISLVPGAGGCREHDILVGSGDGAKNITKFPSGPERNVVRR